MQFTDEPWQGNLWPEFFPMSQSSPSQETQPDPQVDLTLLNEPRFSEPPGWRWHRFTTTGGYRLRYGSVHPKDTIADGVVVMLPGLRDFAEQYFELAHDLLRQNLAVWVLDWRGQGDSDRYLPNRHKRHSAGFDRDIRDLFELVDGYILPSAVHPEVGRLPLIMLGHSMGAHLGLRFLRECNQTAKGKQIFSAAVLASPMLWIEQLKPMPIWFAQIIAELLAIMPTAYIPGGQDWSLQYRMSPYLTGKYSHDGNRIRLQDSWFTKCENLRVGSPTTRWLYEAVKSCARVNKPSYLQGIGVPTLLAAAGDDEIVSNPHIKAAATALGNGRYVEIPGALHEILMESDDIRGNFLSQFLTFVRENVLDKANKGISTF